MFLDYWETVLNIIQSSVTSIALIASGFWAYYKLFRGRVYHQKLELSVECKSYLEKDSLIRLHITTVLKNLGLSIVHIDQESSGLIIYGILKNRYQDLTIDVAKSKRVYLGAFSLFENHQWIEPSEIIQDHNFIESKSNCSAFMVEAIVISTKQQWHSSCIAVIDIDNNNHFDRQRKSYDYLSGKTARNKRRNGQRDKTVERRTEETRGANAATATRA